MYVSITEDTVVFSSVGIVDDEVIVASSGVDKLSTLSLFFKTKHTIKRIITKAISIIGMIFVYFNE